MADLSLRAEAAFNSGAISAETNAASLKPRDFLSHIVHSSYSWFMRFCSPLFESADSKCEVTNRSCPDAWNLRGFTTYARIMFVKKNEANFDRDFIYLNFERKINSNNCSAREFWWRWWDDFIKIIQKQTLIRIIYLISENITLSSIYVYNATFYLHIERLQIFFAKYDVT